LPNCVTPKDALKFRWPVESLVFCETKSRASLSGS
jgi:hypothetical protein